MRTAEVTGSTAIRERRLATGMCQTLSPAAMVNGASTAAIASGKPGASEAAVTPAGSSWVTRGTGSLAKLAMRAANCDSVAA